MYVMPFDWFRAHTASFSSFRRADEDAFLQAHSSTSRLVSAGMAQGAFSHKVEGIREQIEDLQGACRVAFRLVDQMARQETPEQRKKLYAC